LWPDAGEIIREREKSGGKRTERQNGQKIPAQKAPEGPFLTNCDLPD
jgi:hypothetical protein